MVTHPRDYRAPRGFVPITSHHPSIEVYGPIKPGIGWRCATCGGLRVEDEDCIGCGSSEARAAREPVWIAPVITLETAKQQLHVYCSALWRPHGFCDQLRDATWERCWQREWHLSLPTIGDGDVWDQVETVLPPPCSLVDTLGPERHKWWDIRRPVWRVTLGEHTYIVDAVTGEISGSLPLHWRRLWTRITILLLVGVGVGVCIGTPLMPVFFSGAVFWIVALAILALVERKSMQWVLKARDEDAHSV